MHQPVNVLDDAGSRLADKYNIGTSYPVFILTNSSGEIITRWTGYTGGAQGFVRTLQNALKDLRTVAERVSQFKAQPTLREAAALARFFSEIGEHLKAVEYFNKAEALRKGPGAGFSYDIFKNTSNAVWNDKAKYEIVFPVADKALTTNKSNARNVIGVARIMSRMSRKFERTDSLKKYLQAGIAAAKNSTDPKLNILHYSLSADMALQIDSDTVQAINIKKQSMGADWSSDRDKAFSFAKWCLERKINLEESESIARRTVDLVFPGKYRAKVLSTFALILDARGKTDEAIAAVLQAIEQYADDPYYSKQLKRLRGETVE